MSTSYCGQLRHSKDPRFAGVYALIDRCKETSLRTGASLIAPAVLAWTPDASAELYRRIALEPDESKNTFTGKLVAQLEGAGQEEHLLLADLLVVHLLATDNIGLEKKLELVNAVGALAPHPFEVPESMHEALRVGPVNAGIGFLTNRFWIVSFLIAFASKWTNLGDERRSELLADPWAMKAFVADVPGERDQSQRNALLFLLFPETFEDITSDDHKRRILEAHADVAGDDPDLDRRLLSARQALEKRYGVDLNWYSSDVRPTWDRSSKQHAVGAAEEVDALSLLRKHFPRERDLHRFAQAMAEAITAAHEINPAGWTLNRRSGGAALTTGPNNVLGVRNGALTVAATGVVEDTLGLDVFSNATVKAFNAPPGALWIQCDVDRLHDALDAVADTFLETVRRSARSNAPVRRYFAEDLVVAVEELTGMNLPRPDLARSDGDRAWIVRMKRDGVREVAQAIERGDCRVFWQIEVQPGSSLEKIRQAFIDADPDLSPHRLGNQAGQVHRFITKMGVGDFVLAPDADDLYIGQIASDARYEDGEWIRDVDWANGDEPVGRDAISTALYARLRTLLTITEISDLAGELATLVDVAEGTTDVAAVAPGLSEGISLRSVDSELSHELHLDHRWLQELVDLLGRRRQLIFYGPPGTGKTYLAERLAQHLVAEPSNYRIVQFHPSYSYEDFVEGFRPVVNADREMVYELKPGPLKQLADEARSNPGEPFVLIVDEINRGNLAKIFGELYYLLEYRERSIVLQYGTGVDDEFSLPANLFLIGTMNTADRSIALVDAAIRRRFGFVEFSPLESPVGDMLSTWLRRKGRDDRPARLLAELNRRLNDRDLSIGPSYLMKPDSADDSGLERIWRYEIMPLLVEQFYGRPEMADQFKLSALLKEIEGDEPGDQDGDDADEH